MKTILKSLVEPGMVLAKPVYYKDELIIDRNKVIDEADMVKLTRYAIQSVTVKEPEDLATSQMERIRLSPGYQEFEGNYNKFFPAYKSILINFIEEKIPVNLQNLLTIYKKIIAGIENIEDRLDYVYYRPPGKDDVTYEHCLNCAIISGVFGAWWHMNQEELHTLILCGFFFDIGKLKLPKELLEKTDKLSDFERNWLKTHAQVGYELLKEQNLNEHILNATWMHHERKDGSGYPQHLKGDQIDEFARYIAIVDSYDAMTSPRSYRNAMPIFDVIMNFEETGYDRYDRDLILPIIKNLAKTQIGRVVQLNDHRKGIITDISKLSYGKPIVSLQDGSKVDLYKCPELSICKYL